jgi:cytochrome c551/c552
MSGRARWFRLALGTSILGVTFALSGCGAAALPPPPPPAVATRLAAETQAPAASPTKATGAPTPAATVSSVNAALIATGKAAFVSAGCGNCHISTAAGTSGTVGPSLDGIGALHNAAWILVQIQNPCAPGHSTAGGPKYSCATMPANLASGTQALAIAAFLASQK